MKNIKWKTIIGLILLYTAVFTGQNWIWGALFLFWVIPDLFTGVTYFIEPISRKDNPALYWIIIFSWILMSVYMLGNAFRPEWFPI